MLKRRRFTPLVLSMVILLIAPALAVADNIVEVQNYGDALVFEPIVEAADMTLVVIGPCNYKIRRSLSKDRELVFELGKTTIDGRYRFEVTAIPEIDSGIIDVLQDARESGDNSEVDQLCRSGKLPGTPQVQQAGFGVINQEIVYDPDAFEKAAQLEKAAAPVAGGIAGAQMAAAQPPVAADQAAVPLKDFVIIDDLIVDGSACIGFDCVNGEVFGFDTIRLKENNLRIQFEDTSTAASFPTNEWQLVANDSANGGASKFSIFDESANRTVFTVEANAPSHSLYVDDGGRIGNRTSTPSVDIHSKDGDTPTLRLEQDTSSGFAAQTWDVAGNETNFFIRDASNGSTLPFRVRPGADSNAIFVDTDNAVGMGTASPDADGLHVLRTGTVEQRILLKLSNQGAPQSELENTDSGITWRFGQNGAGDFVINDTADLGTAEMRVTTGGDVYVNGTMVHSSSRLLKKDFVRPNPQDVLSKVRKLPVSVWSFKDRETRHVGPMAEEFYAMFGFGASDRYISDGDQAGIALLAIQGLDEKLREKDEHIELLEARLAALEARLEQ